MKGREVIVNGEEKSKCLLSFVGNDWNDGGGDPLRGGTLGVNWEYKRSRWLMKGGGEMRQRGGGRDGLSLEEGGMRSGLKGGGRHQLEWGEEERK